MRLGTYPSWFALQVVPGSERRTELALEYKGYQVYVPMRTVRRQWSDRAKVLESPLFSGYIFCRIHGPTLGKIISTPKIVRIVSFGGQPCPIIDEEIEALRQLTALGNSPQPHPFVAIGERVQIIEGPLAGVIGILEQFRGKQRLVISVEAIMKSMSVEVEFNHVRRLEDNSNHQRSPQLEAVA
jgi:transcription antitermination factor NusG